MARKKRTLPVVIKLTALVAIMATAIIICCCHSENNFEIKNVVIKGTDGHTTQIPINVKSKDDSATVEFSFKENIYRLEIKKTYEEEIISSVTLEEKELPPMACRGTQYVAYNEGKNLIECEISNISTPKPKPGQTKKQAKVGDTTFTWYE